MSDHVIIFGKPVETASGRLTTPAPKPGKLLSRFMRKYDAWLLGEAQAEGRHRGEGRLGDGEGFWTYVWPRFPLSDEDRYCLASYLFIKGWLNGKD